jgi:YHS domain-containing protein
MKPLRGSSQEGRAMTRDPVCGMQVDEGRTTATFVYGGKTYYFCSKACQQAFENAPEKYVTQDDHGD